MPSSKSMGMAGTLMLWQ